jgi:hypothetical protein
MSRRGSAPAADGATRPDGGKGSKAIPADKAFRRDRLETSGQRITYMAHGKGYVMARHPGAMPFAIPEALWRSFDYWTAKPADQPKGGAA